jgi:hypothetical protein
MLSAYYYINIYLFTKDLRMTQDRKIRHLFISIKYTVFINSENTAIYLLRNLYLNLESHRRFHPTSPFLTNITKI